MSVINQMLKDLEQRRAQGFDNGSGMLDDLDAGVDDNDKLTHNKKNFWWLLVLLLFIGTGLGLFLTQAGQKKTTPVAVIKQQVEMPVKSIEVAPSAEPEIISVVEETVSEESKPVETVIEEIVSEESKPVETLVVAEIQPQENTIAEEMLISTILPSPPTATGLREIITVHGSGFIAPVKVTMEWDGGRAFKELEPWQVKVINKAEMQLHVNFGTSPDDWRMIIERDESDTRAEYQFSVIAAAKKIIEEKTPVIIESVFNKKETALTNDEQVRLAYAEASNILQQGKTSDAKKLLRKVLLLDFTHIKARQTLAALLFREQQYDEAIEILELGRIQNPQHVSFTLLLARIHTERGQDPIAVDLLERIKPDVATNSDYYALLAALYQRGAQYKNAAAVYEKLLSVYPGRAVWWMGLGLSLQSTERKKDALSAYQKALSAQGLTVELKRFIKKRMATLQ